ncbi:Mitochondrial carrier protein mtm1 [Thalictrum thalictroides]|uniref:Mitochondrial carrier protein mtm1 n=1 Tax=Thalictrum thalictroides TaxID=46969 RepID=A0A7J6WQT9_THATH|nr:Mitochondrial carrier protein mtm1 [Thalictrum thalictroides]
MVCPKQTVGSWMSDVASRVNFDANISSSSSGSSISEEEKRMFSQQGRHVSSASTSASHSPHHQFQQTINLSDIKLGFGERALSAAGAAFFSAILVNPLDLAKTRLQAQAAVAPNSPFWHHITHRLASFGPNTIFSDLRCSPSCSRGGYFGAMAMCPPDCFQYKGTLDVFNKIIRQEGFVRLWRGTNASLALAVPTVGIYLPCYDIFRNWIEEFTNQRAPYLTPYAPLVAGSVARSVACVTCYPVELAKTRMQAFKEIKIGGKPPGVWKTLIGIISPVTSTSYLQTLQSYRLLWTGVGAQLARDVPFSAICWSTLEPMRRRFLGLVGEEANAASILGANFAAGFVAGSLAAGATCPLDVAKTRRQIEKDPARALSMTTFRTLKEVLRDRGMTGLFTGFGPRVARAGPSVGIVVSSYEVVKYALYRRHTNS